MLERLEIDVGKKVTGDGITHIATLTKLKELLLAGKYISSDRLLQLKPLTNLEKLTLNLGDRQFVDDGLAILMEMPKLSDTMTEGVLRRWQKMEGDNVELGDVIAEVETDKATMEFEAFDEGVLLKRLVGDGVTVSVGSPISSRSM